MAVRALNNARLAFFGLNGKKALGSASAGRCHTKALGMEAAGKTGGVPSGGSGLTQKSHKVSVWGAERAVANDGPEDFFQNVELGKRALGGGVDLLCGSLSNDVQRKAGSPFPKTRTDCCNRTGAHRGLLSGDRPLEAGLRRSARQEDAVFRERLALAAWQKPAGRPLRLYGWRAYGVR